MRSRRHPYARSRQRDRRRSRPALAEACEADELEPTTIAAYRQHVRLHIKPLIVGAVVAADPAHVVVYRNQLVAADRGPWSCG